MVTCTAFLIVFSNLGTFAYEAVFNQAEGYRKGTTVGTVNIEGLSSQEAMGKMAATVEEWKANTIFKLKMQDKEILLTPTFFKIDIKGSLAGVVDGQSSPLVASIDEGILKEQIKQTNEQIASFIDYSTLMGHLKQNIDLMKPVTYEMDLFELVKNNNTSKQVLSRSVTTGFDRQLEGPIFDWIDKLNSISIKAMESYSLLSIVDGERISNQRLEALNVIATGLYEAALLAGFDIQERYISTTLPPYSKLGLEAKVIPGKMDLAFNNPKTSDITIKLELVDSKLIISIEGFTSEYKYDVIQINQKTYKPKIIIQYTASLQGSETKVQKGIAGQSIDVYRKKLDLNNQLLESELISNDFYLPVHTVVQMPLTGESETITTHSDETNLTNRDTRENSSSPSIDESSIWGSPDEVQKGD